VAKQSKLSLVLGLCLILCAILLSTTGWAGQESERGKCEKACETQYQACGNAPNTNQAACKNTFDSCRAGCKDVRPHPSPTATVEPSPEGPTATPTGEPKGTPSGTPSPTLTEPTPTHHLGNRSNQKERNEQSDILWLLFFLSTHEPFE